MNHESLAHSINMLIKVSSGSGGHQFGEVNLVGPSYPTFIVFELLNTFGRSSAIAYGSVISRHVKFEFQFT